MPHFMCYLSESSFTFSVAINLIGHLNETTCRLLRIPTTIVHNCGTYVVKLNWVVLS